MDESLINCAALYACLYAKEFPAQALLRLRPELRAQPCAVMDGTPPLRHVCSFNLQARAIGVVSGMTQVEIETFRSVKVLLRSKAEEAAARSALLDCAGTFSPRVEDQSGDGAFLCVIDIAGTERLLGSPRVLAETLLRSAKALGIAARVAVSGNFHAAICSARGMAAENSIIVISPAEEAATLASLPLSVLDLSECQAETLSLWGVHTLGMLAALPEKPLIARLGQDGKRLSQLARGIWPHLFLPVEPAFKLEEQIELDTPVELLTSLLFVVGVMLEQLTLRASARALALASVTIRLSLEDKTHHTRTIRPTLPSDNRQLWIKLIHLDLEAHPPQAAIASLAVSAEPGSTGRVQLGLFAGPLPESARLDLTLARIRAIVGENNVGRATLKDTHQPDSFHLVPFSVPSEAVSATAASKPRAAMRQLRPPERTRVALRNQRPSTFFFREKRYVVEHAYGPWLTSGEWWNPTLWGFEQWDLIARSPENQLLYCCLVHDLTRNCWQIAALYD